MEEHRGCELWVQWEGYVSVSVGVYTLVTGMAHLVSSFTIHLPFSHHSVYCALGPS